jgi:glycosyltransferase involved in cell wall biosynthesis
MNDSHFLWPARFISCSVRSMSRPVVAIISNALTPYRLHFHRRLVREASGIEWWSLFTHDQSNAPWPAEAEAEIRPVWFGRGERSDDQSRPGRILHEYRKGGRIIAWLAERQTAAVILLGYNDPGRLRILRWCHQSRVPCFLFGDSNVRDDSATGPKAALKRRLLPAILRQCTGILACGSLGQEYFRRYGVPSDRIWLMPYEPDYAMIAAVTQPDINAAFARQRLPTDRDYLLYCGRLVPPKRVDLALAAFLAVASERPTWDLLVVGDGPLRDGLCRSIPEALRPRVHWAGFSADQRHVAALQRGSRILVLPSDTEPWGVVINEAVAAGLAVVASDAVGAAAELVRDRVNGRIFPSGNAAALTAAIRDVTEPEALARYRESSGAVLAAWRAKADPVAGLLAALAAAGVRPASVV